jgi:hypothetical protein
VKEPGIEDKMKLSALRRSEIFLYDQKTLLEAFFYVQTFSGPRSVDSFGTFLENRSPFDPTAFSSQEASSGWHIESPEQSAEPRGVQWLHCSFLAFFLFCA